MITRSGATIHTDLSSADLSKGKGLQAAPFLFRFIVYIQLIRLLSFLKQEQEKCLWITFRYAHFTLQHCGNQVGSCPLLDCMGGSCTTV